MYSFRHLYGPSWYRKTYVIPFTEPSTSGETLSRPQNRDYRRSARSMLPCLHKISICLFLLRMFGKNKRIWRSGLYSIMAFSIATYLGSVAVIYASCRPVQKSWNPDIPGICWRPRIYIAIAEYNGSESPLSIAKGKSTMLMCHPAISILSDWTLASLPIVFIWNIQMSIKIKVGIITLMGAGFLC